MKKLTLLLIVGLCLAVSGFADVVDKPQAGDKKPQAGQAGDKALKKPPLLRKAPPVPVKKATKRPPIGKGDDRGSRILNSQARPKSPRNERGGDYNSTRSNTSRRAPRAATPPKRQSLNIQPRVDTPPKPRVARKGNALRPAPGRPNKGNNVLQDGRIISTTRREMGINELGEKSQQLSKMYQQLGRLEILSDEQVETYRNVTRRAQSIKGEGAYPIVRELQEANEKVAAQNLKIKEIFRELRNVLKNQQEELILINKANSKRGGQ